MQAIGHLGEYFAQQQEARSSKKAKRDAEAAKSMDTIVREQIRGSSWESVQQKLAENDINSFDALINLSDDDINSLGLSLGNKGLLRGYIRSMRKARLFGVVFSIEQLPASFIAQLTGTSHPGAEAGTLFVAFAFISKKFVRHRRVMVVGG